MTLGTEMCGDKPKAKGLFWLVVEGNNKLVLVSFPPPRKERRG